MTGKTHIAAGALASFVMIPFGYHIFFMFVAGFAAIVPDMDATEAYIHHVGIPITKDFRLKPFWIPAKMFSLLFKHRGWLHSLFGLGLFSLFFTAILYSFSVPQWQLLGLSFTIGYWSHLLLDSSTVSGVALFWPVYKKRIRIAKIRTGSWQEKFWEIIFLIALGVGLMIIIFSGYFIIDLNDFYYSSFWTLEEAFNYFSYLFK